jgi:hypothetical protein
MNGKSVQREYLRISILADSLALPRPEGAGDISYIETYPFCSAISGPGAGGSLCTPRIRKGRAATPHIGCFVYDKVVAPTGTVRSQTLRLITSRYKGVEG